MNEITPMHEEFTTMFQKWARTNLTSSFKKSSILRNMEQKTPITDVGDVIDSMRKSKLIEPASTWDSKYKLWWNASTSCNFHDMSQMLVEDSTLIRWKNPLDGTALHYVAKNGNLRCLNLLVKLYHTDVNVQSKGSTPLHIAVTFSQRLFVRHLVEIYHAQTDIMDYSGRFPLTLIPPSLTGELKTLLSSGRLARIQESLSILKLKPAPSQSSRHALMSAAGGTLARIHIKTFSKSASTTVSEPMQLLLSTLAGDGDQDVNKMIRCLHHGQSVPVCRTFSKPCSANEQSSISRKSALPPTQTLLHRKLEASYGRASVDASSKAVILDKSADPSRRHSHALSLRAGKKKSASVATLPSNPLSCSPDAEKRRGSIFRIPSSDVMSLPWKRRIRKEGSSIDRKHQHFSLPRKMTDLLTKQLESVGKENKPKRSQKAVERLSFSGFSQVDEGVNYRISSTTSVSRQSSTSLNSSSVDSAMFPSMSSSVEPPRSQSISSLTECTEALLNQFLISSGQKPD